MTAPILLVGENEFTVASPCIKNCCLNEQVICMGCGRSLEEIKMWGQADNLTRLSILQNAQQRQLLRR